MTRRELLENYRLLVLEIDTLERQSAFLNQYLSGPQPLRSVQLTGMPRGTNDPEAAALQRVDSDEVLEKIEDRCRELRGLLDEFERIIDSIADRRLRIVIRNYYALGWTDEQIAEQMELSHTHVNRIRNAFIDELN